MVFPDLCVCLIKKLLAYRPTEYTLMGEEDVADVIEAMEKDASITKKEPRLYINFDGKRIYAPDPKESDVYYNDIELHFLMAKFYIKNNQYNKANFHIDECLNLLPDYFPAHKIKREISKHLATTLDLYKLPGLALPVSLTHSEFSKNGYT